MGPSFLLSYSLSALFFSSSLHPFVYLFPTGLPGYPRRLFLLFENLVILNLIFFFFEYILTAIKGTVVSILGNRSLNEDLQYNVRVQEVYHNSNLGIHVNRILDIQTPGNSCGIDSLEMGSSYLISGGKYTDVFYFYYSRSSNKVVVALLLSLL